MSSGQRLKEERKRLGLNQTGCANLGGVQISAQTNYENDKRSPDAAYLAALAAEGIDVQYVVTGKRAGDGLGEAAVHQAVLDAVDLLSLGKKVDADQLAKAVIKLCQRSQGGEPPVVKVRGDVGQYSEGDITNKAPIKFNMGRKNK